jgi:hypothetical protein
MIEYEAIDDFYEYNNKELYESIKNRKTIVNDSNIQLQSYNEKRRTTEYANKRSSWFTKNFMETWRKVFKENKTNQRRECIS